MAKIFDFDALVKALNELSDRLRRLENKRTGVTQDWQLVQDSATGNLMAVNNKTGVVVQIAP